MPSEKLDGMSRIDTRTDLLRLLPLESADGRLHVYGVDGYDEKQHIMLPQQPQGARMWVPEILTCFFRKF